MGFEELKQLEGLLEDLIWEVKGEELRQVMEVKMIVEGKLDDLQCDD